MSEAYPVQTVCAVLDCPRSSYYTRPKGKRLDEALVAAVEQVLLRYPYYGYRRVNAQLRRQGVRASERQVRRVLKHLGRARVSGGYGYGPPTATTPTHAIPTSSASLR
jgi:putative transposase